MCKKGVPICMNYETTRFVRFEELTSSDIICLLTFLTIWMESFASSNLKVSHHGKICSPDDVSVLLSAIRGIHVSIENYTSYGEVIDMRSNRFHIPWFIDEDDKVRLRV
jgi:hypothetical protein